MKDWQYGLAVWVLAALGLSLAFQNHPGYALPCVILATAGCFKLAVKHERR
jgi:hypothetical protein